MAKIKDGTKLITNVVRLSYPHLFEKYSMDPKQEGKYSCCLLIPKDDTETLGLIEQLVSEVEDSTGRKLWGGKIPKNVHNPLRDGDEEKDTEAHPEWKGMMFLNATSNRRPGVINMKKENLEEDEIKAGDYVRAAINFYAYSNSGNNGVAVGLNNIQKVRNGEALGGTGASAESDFDDDFVAPEEDEDDLGI